MAATRPGAAPITHANVCRSSPGLTASHQVRSGAVLVSPISARQLHVIWKFRHSPMALRGPDSCFTFVQQEGEDMAFRREFPFEVEVIDPWWIALSDGTRIASTLWRPKTSKKAPVIVEMIPYRRRD